MPSEDKMREPIRQRGSHTLLVKSPLVLPFHFLLLLRGEVILDVELLANLLRRWTSRAGEEEWEEILSSVNHPVNNTGWLGEQEHLLAHGCTMTGTLGLHAFDTLPVLLADV